MAWKRNKKSKRAPFMGRSLGTHLAMRTACIVVLMIFPCVVATAAIVETRLLAVDMGVDWMKGAALRFEASDGGTPQATMSLVLSDQANRKIPPCVAFRYFNNSHVGRHTAGGDERPFRQERSFAEQAQALESRFPHQVVCSPVQLLGLVSTPPTAQDGGDFLCDVVSLERESKRRALGVAFPLGSTTSKASAGDIGAIFSAEELTGMLLGHMKHMAEKADRSANRLSEEDEQSVTASIDGGALGYNVVRHAAVTVPSFASVAQRQALVESGALAGLRVVRLVHSVTAAAVHLAYLKTQQLLPVSRATSAQDTPSSRVFAMIYDMGSRQTEAAVFEYRQPSFVATLGQKQPAFEGSIELVAMATNRTLGGRAFDHCIATHWDREFLSGSVFATPAGSISVAERTAVNKRRLSLLRAARRAREILSANREAAVTAEGVPVPGQQEQVPFSPRLSRDAFETICAPLFEEALRIRDEALHSTNGAVPNVAALSRLEVIGGGTRMPRLLHMLGRGYGSNGMVDRTLNGDEAAVVGTGYLGAASARLAKPRFSVREWLTNDIAFTLTPALPREGRGGTGAPSRPPNATYFRPPHILFPSRATLLPAVQTVRLMNRTEDFSFSFWSPPAGEMMPSVGAERSTVPCNGCFFQSTRVHKVVEALAAAREAEANMNDTVTKWGITTTTSLKLRETEVVVEAAVSESGLPYVRKAFVLATYTKTVHTAAAAAAAATADDKSVKETQSGRQESAATSAGTTEVSSSADIAPGEAFREEEAAVGTVENEMSGSDAGGTGDQDEHVAGSQSPTSTHAPVKLKASHKTLVKVFPVAVQLLDNEENDFGLSVTYRTNMRRNEVRASRDTLRKLQREDDAQLYLGTLRNDIESLVSSFKAKDEWDKLSSEATTAAEAEGGQTATQDWRTVVEAVSVWMDEEGDNADAAALEERKNRLLQLQNELHAGRVAEGQS